MALVKCGECGREMAASAPACPGCGAPKKKGTSCAAWGCLVLIAFMALPVGMCMVDSGQRAADGARRASAPKQLSEQEKRLGEIPEPCPGRYLKTSIFGTPKAPPCPVELALSKMLKDPDSFQMDERCQILDGKTSWVARCDYRSRNSFGGMVRSTTDFYIKGGIVVKMSEAR